MLGLEGARSTLSPTPGCACIFYNAVIGLDDTVSRGISVQEFVHSDNGRTIPSLGLLLGCEAQILELDVEEVHMDYLA